jgi:hypothetical protein
MLKEATEKCKELDAIKVQKKVEEEEKLRKRSAEIKKAQEDARKEAEEEARERSAAAGAGAAGGGFGGTPGGMEGMMAGLMSDPEIAAGLQNPKVVRNVELPSVNAIFIAGTYSLYSLIVIKCRWLRSRSFCLVLEVPWACFQILANFKVCVSLLRNGTGDVLRECKVRCLSNTQQ